MSTESEIADQYGVTFERIDTGAAVLRVALAGDGPMVILAHGFPECWYSWRHQIAPLAQAGFRVAAPDMRGYGESDNPHEIEQYDMQSMTGDMAGLAAVLSPDEPAIIIGHDWGAPIAWNSALLHAERFRAVCGMSVPHVPPGDIAALDLYNKIFTDKGYFFYMLYFQQKGIAEAELEADTNRSLRLFYTAIAGDAAPNAWPLRKPVGQKLFDGVAEPDMPRHWLSNDDLAYYTAQFEKSGFHGPVNRYRNFARDSAYLKSHGKTLIEQPSLYLTGSRDMVNNMYPKGPVAAMTLHLKGPQRSHILEGCGHWTQQERIEEVNDIMIDWITSL